MAKNFNQFADGSVLLITSIEQENAICEGVAADIDVGSYELLDRAGEVCETGQVYIPDRIKNLCRTRVPVCLIYMGSKLMLSGKEQLDIKVITDEKTIYSTSTPSPSAFNPSPPAAKRKPSGAVVDVSDDDGETNFIVTFNK